MLHHHVVALAPSELLRYQIRSLVFSLPSNLHEQRYFSAPRTLLRCRSEAVACLRRGVTTDLIDTEHPHKPSSWQCQSHHECGGPVGIRREVPSWVTSPI